MGNGITGLLIGAGLSIWMYTVMVRQTGTTTKTSLIVAGLTGLAGFFVVYTAMSMFLR